MLLSGNVYADSCLIKIFLIDGRRGLWICQPVEWLNKKLYSWISFSQSKKHNSSVVLVTLDCMIEFVFVLISPQTGQFSVGYAASHSICGWLPSSISAAENMKSKQSNKLVFSHLIFKTFNDIRINSYLLLFMTQQLTLVV